jgi:hypothetical protein
MLPMDPRARVYWTQHTSFFIIILSIMIPLAYSSADLASLGACSFAAAEPARAATLKRRSTKSMVSKGGWVEKTWRL